MKSLLVSSIYFPPQVGGISHFMARIASTLGPDRVCCLTGVSAKGTSTGDNLIPRVYRRPMALGSAGYLQALAWGVTIPEIMIRERPQIVQLGTVYDGFAGRWLRRWLKLPFVVYAHGNEILDAMHGNSFAQATLHQASRVLANSAFTADLVQKTGVDPQRIEIVHPGCDINRFHAHTLDSEMRQKLLGSKSRDRVILTVGGLVARKGHDMVIRAMAQLLKATPDITYLIVGNGPYGNQLENLATSLGIRDHVIFAGHISDEDLPDIYALCDVFVMPSREHLESCDVEGFGLVFLEANACGKPVIGGRSGGIPDAIVDGITGFLVNPGDPEDIANALNRLLADKELASRMGHQGRLRAVKDFDWPTVGNQVHQILENTLREVTH